jgi:ribosomal-protein-serine acetyltransferase
MFTWVIEPGLELRLLEMHHAEELLRLTEKSRNSLRQWLPWVDGTRDVKDTENFITGAKKQNAANTGFHAGIWYEGQLAGVICFYRIDWFHRAAGIGYWLDESFRGKGIMTKACEAMVNHALTELHLNRVEIRAAVGNTQSRAIPERLGFVQEGIVREAEWLYDHFVDHVIYGILRNDWKR